LIVFDHGSIGACFGTLVWPITSLSAGTADSRRSFQLAPNWRAFLARVIRAEDVKLLRAHEHTGRPLAEEVILATLEQDLGRILRRRKPGLEGGPRS